MEGVYTESPFNFISRVKGLKDKTGPILFQLPAFLKINAERLNQFIHHLPTQYKYVFELRHSSWFTQEVYDILHKYDAVLCITDLAGQVTPKEITASFTYIRLHGPEELYRGSYSTKQLTEWKKNILAWAQHRIHVYCYFDNEEKGYAIQDAKKLKELVIS